MKTIVKMKFGSHLYGLNTPSSDTDIKGIYIPEYRDIILGRVPKTSINTTTGLDNSKNSAEDIDTEMFTLQGFIRMCSQGQTCAVDMLFAPDSVIIESSPEWEFIKANRDKLVIGKAASFIGYCYQQANKYGIKGSRISAIESVLEILREVPDGKLGDIYDDMKKNLSDAKHIEFIKIPVKKGMDATVDAIDVCGRKFDVKIGIKYMSECLEKILDNYGDRARQAQNNENIDWKALSHALRVCYEAEELLATGSVTFPFTGWKKETLMNVKLGKVEYNEVAQVLERKMLEVRELEALSKLPEKIPQKFWDDFIYKTYHLSHKI